VVRLRQLWQNSLLFRRIAAVSVFLLASLAVYLASNIPRAVSLPNDELNAKAVTLLGDERMVLKNPAIAEGGLALSYTGSKNEVADVWLENATLDDASSRLLLPNTGVQQPALVSYITGGEVRASPSDDTCHTTIEVRRAAGSPPVEALTLYQSDEEAGAQRFRQVVLDAGKTPMEVEVHTDPPPRGDMNSPGCQKILAVGANPQVQMPEMPVRFLVTGGRIDLHFNPSSPLVSIFTGTGQTFESVSLGDNKLQGSGLQVVAAKMPKAPAKLNVQASPATSEVSFSHLRLGSDKLQLDVGADGEKALVYANGVSQNNYDLIATIQKNPIWGAVLGAVLIPALIAWVKKNLFPSTASAPAAPNTDVPNTDAKE
jgi:hypothetical protein